MVDFIKKEWKEFITLECLNNVKIFIDFLKNQTESIKNFKKFDTRLSESQLCICKLNNILLKTEEDYSADIDIFTAYYMFALKSTKRDCDLNELGNIIRIVLNFQESYRNQFSTMEMFLKAITKAINYQNGILEYFANTDLKTEYFGNFSLEQKNEEIIKAKLLIENENEWQNAIYKAENHKYFNGTIGWLLRFSKEFDENNKALIESNFKKCVEFLEEKFDENGIKNKQDIATILKYQDIRFDNGLFPRNKGERRHNKDGDAERDSNLFRDKSWKRFFRELGYRNKDEKDIRWLYFWYQESRSDVNGEEWCQEGHSDVNGLEEWRQWLIYYPDILYTENGYNIGGIKTNLYAEYIIIGNEWDKQAFSSLKFDIPLLIASKRIDNLKYGGFSNESNQESARYNLNNKDYEIKFEYDISKKSKGKYIIEGDKRLEVEVDNIENAIKNIRDKLESL